VAGKYSGRNRTPGVRFGSSCDSSRFKIERVDREITGSEEGEFNRKYRALLDEAVELSFRLSLPGTRDRFRR